MNYSNNPDYLKYDDDFLQFCFKNISKDFKENSCFSLRNFFISFLSNLSCKNENPLLFPIKGPLIYKNPLFLKFNI